MRRHEASAPVVETVANLSLLFFLPVGGRGSVRRQSTIPGLLVQLRGGSPGVAARAVVGWVTKLGIRF